MLLDDDDFDVEKVVAPAPAASTGPKKDWDEPEESFEAITAREAKEAAEKAAGVPKNPNAGKPKEPKKKLEPAPVEKELTKEEALIESRKREQLVKDSDLKNAIDLFGADSAPAKKASPAAGDLATMNPQSEAEFIKFAAMLTEHAVTLSGSPHYLSFVKEVVKHLSDPMSVDDVRELMKPLNNLVNEKIKQAKGGKAKAAPKKPAAKLNVKGGANEDKFEDHIGDKYDDIADDFM